MPPTDLPRRGLTVREVAALLRVSSDKVRTWIASAELGAVNVATSLCGKPRWVITPDALAAFEKARTVAPVPKPNRRRRRQAAIDYYPD